MQQSSAVTVDLDGENPVMPLFFSNGEVSRAIRHLKAGAKIEVKFKGRCQPDDIAFLNDLRSDTWQAIKMDDLSHTAVTTIYASTNTNGSSDRPYSFEILKGFHKWPGRRQRFFSRLERLEYIKVLSAKAHPS